MFLLQCGALLDIVFGFFSIGLYSVYVFVGGAHSMKCLPFAFGVQHNCSTVYWIVVAT